jgi:Cu/Ag efflux protein CusF
MLRKQIAVSLVASIVLAAPALADVARGVITKVDLDKKEVEVRGKGRGARKGSMTFILGNDTQVTVGKKDGSLKNLKVGRRVRVEYEAQDNQRVITAIRVKGGKGAREDRPILGKLQRVSPQQRKITVLGRNAQGEKRTEITLDLPPDVKVTRAGNPIKLSDLKEGAFVRVVRQARAGKNVATAIQVIDPDAVISRARETMSKADFYLKMAEWYLKSVQKPAKTEPKKPMKIEQDDDE